MTHTTGYKLEVSNNLLVALDRFRNGDRQNIHFWTLLYCIVHCIVHLFAVNSFTKLHIYVVRNKHKIARNMYTDKKVSLERISDLYYTVQKRIRSIGVENIQRPR